MHFYIVDCFAEKKYQGNQLAVFVSDLTLKAEEMQTIANEMGFSETCFVYPSRDEGESYDVRIFTPDVELPFAGHPVIGVSSVIHSVLARNDNETIRINLLIGQIIVEHKQDIFTMEQKQPVFGKAFLRKEIAGVLNLDVDNISEENPIQWVSTGLPAIIIPLKKIEYLEKCKVDYYLMEKFLNEQCKCNLLAFCWIENEARVRVFMDDEGFFEDAATGSANGCLAAYMLKNGYLIDNRENTYTVKQGIEMGRPSKLYVKAQRNGTNYSIYVGGKAHIIAEGEWYT